MKNEELITKIAMRKAHIKSLYDKELEKRIIETIKEKKGTIRQIKHTKDLLDFL